MAWLASTKVIRALLLAAVLCANAAWADSNPSTPRQGAFRLTAEDRSYWAFQPVRRLSIVGQATGRNALDHWLASGLAKAGLRMNPPATRWALIRRAYFNLLGLPPEPEEAASFQADSAPDAWARLVDRLLASPRFGERWGRHWLDVVRYAETNGYERDGAKPHAWRYRDYVIEAFNANLPYDQFTREQLAGDLVAPDSSAALIATGFYRLHVWDDEPDKTELADYDELDDMLSTTGQAFLGLTIGCARCHDHKFDPLSQKEYYQLLAFFRGVELYGRPHKGGGSRPQGEITRPLVGSAEMALAIRDRPEPVATRVLRRGDPAAPGETVAPAFPAVLGGAAGDARPGRSQMAAWIARADNPLTARVFVNRVWQHLFGRGLVATPNDFGRTGMAPTQPELLDLLAADFTRDGWSTKRLIRTIMTSEAYQMSSATRADGLAKDEANERFWRQNLRRVEGEIIRDALLSFSGRQNLKMAGPSFFPEMSREARGTQDSADKGWGTSPPSEQSRRSIYLYAKRALPSPLLAAFDADLVAFPVGARPVTTVAPQALMLLNDPFVQEQASAMAERVLRETANETDMALALAFRWVTQRAPAAKEMAACHALLAEQRKAHPALAWRSFCVALMSLNEALYVD